MAVTKPRSRLVNFRLTEEEFQGLKSASIEQGARSVSDFARSAVLRAFDANANKAPDLNNLMGRLESAVEQIARLTITVGPSAGEPQATEAQPAQACTV
jgi:hypothetical protein